MRQFLLSASLIVLFAANSFAQNFEGSIYFTKSNMVDVTR
jgi:hypothetical protein